MLAVSIVPVFPQHPTLLGLVLVWVNVQLVYRVSILSSRSLQGPCAGNW